MTDCLGLMRMSVFAWQYLKQVFRYRWKIWDSVYLWMISKNLRQIPNRSFVTAFEAAHMQQLIPEFWDREKKIVSWKHFDVLPILFRILVETEPMNQLKMKVNCLWCHTARHVDVGGGETECMFVTDELVTSKYNVTHHLHITLDYLLGVPRLPSD